MAATDGRIRVFDWMLKWTILWWLGIGESCVVETEYCMKTASAAFNPSQIYNHLASYSIGFVSSSYLGAMSCHYSQCSWHHTGSG